MDRPEEGDESVPPPSQRLDTRIKATKASCSIAEGGGRVQLLEESLRNKVEALVNFETPAVQVRE